MTDPVPVLDPQLLKHVLAHVKALHSKKIAPEFLSEKQLLKDAA